MAISTTSERLKKLAELNEIKNKLNSKAEAAVKAEAKDAMDEAETEASSTEVPQPSKPSKPSKQVKQVKPSKQSKKNKKKSKNKKNKAKPEDNAEGKAEMLIDYKTRSVNVQIDYLKDKLVDLKIESAKLAKYPHKLQNIRNEVDMNSNIIDTLTNHKDNIIAGIKTDLGLT